jgi:hypothetical protein
MMFVRVIKVLLLSAIMTSGVSCAKNRTSNYGVYDLIYKERIQQDYDIYFLKHNDSRRLHVDYRGNPICELEFDPEEIRSVICPYRSSHGQTDNITVIYHSNKISTVRRMTLETNTIVLYDHNNDGFPETRVTTNASGRLVEQINPVIISIGSNAVKGN